MAQLKNNALLSTRIIRFASGTGDMSSPYIIRHEADMVVLSLVSKADSLLGIYFKVMDGILQLDLSDSSLGFSSIGSSMRKFMGHFDGNGSTIKILY